MEYALIFLCACFASLLTFYSGFGLGTVLMPIIALFFPLPAAIALTALAHLFHNTLKICFLWKSVVWEIVIRFGVPALLAASLGAFLLKELSFLEPIYIYSVLGVQGEISILHLSIGLLLILFATLESFSGKLGEIKNPFLGGALSGFFGGFSGNQGAFRSAFLIQMGLSKEAFIATGGMIGITIDFVRLTVYGFNFKIFFENFDPFLLFTALGGAFFGVCLGMILLPKTTFRLIQKIVLILL